MKNVGTKGKDHELMFLKLKQSEHFFIKGGFSNVLDGKKNDILFDDCAHRTVVSLSQ